MPRLFFGNYDFEHQLAGAHPGALPATLQRINAERAIAWWPMLQPGDQIWLPGTLERDFFEPLCTRGLTVPEFAGPDFTFAPETHLVPWGWTLSLETWAAREGCRIDSPPAAAVRQANSRRFSFELESRWQAGLEAAAEVHNLGELDRALCKLAESHPRWILKAEFGMAGRECLRGAGSRLEAAQQNWAESRLRRGQALIVEPWVDCVAEMGLQFEIPRLAAKSALQEAGSREDPRFLGCVPLLSGPRGTYQGSRLPDGPVDETWQPAIEVATRAARAIQDLGYFGPLGIDAMLYRGPSGDVRCRPLQDINARFTMGRLAWEWKARLRPESPASWLHVRWGRRHAGSPPDWYKETCDRLPSGVQAFRTAPYQIDGRPTEHGSVLIVACNEPQLHAAERAILDRSDTTSTSGT